MADIIGMLDELQNKALHQEGLKERFLATRNDPSPVSAFCRVCRENSPKLAGQDDFYELFLAAIED